MALPIRGKEAPKLTLLLYLLYLSSINKGKIPARNLWFLERSCRRFFQTLISLMRSYFVGIVAAVRFALQTKYEAENNILGQLGTALQRLFFEVALC